MRRGSLSSVCDSPSGCWVLLRDPLRPCRNQKISTVGKEEKHTYTHSIIRPSWQLSIEEMKGVVEEEEEGKDLAKAGEGQLGRGHGGSVIVWDSCQ